MLGVTGGRAVVAMDPLHDGELVDVPLRAHHDETLGDQLGLEPHPLAAVGVVAVGGLGCVEEAVVSHPAALGTVEPAREAHRRDEALVL